MPFVKGGGKKRGQYKTKARRAAAAAAATEDVIILDEADEKSSDSSSMPSKRSLRASSKSTPVDYYDGRGTKHGARRLSRPDVELMMECVDDELSPAQLAAIQLAEEEHEKANNLIKAARAGNTLVPSSQPNTFTIVPPTVKQVQASVQGQGQLMQGQVFQGLGQVMPGQGQVVTSPGHTPRVMTIATPKVVPTAPPSQGLPPPRTPQFMNKQKTTKQQANAAAPVPDVIVIDETPGPGPRLTPKSPPTQQHSLLTTTSMAGATPQQVYKFVSLAGNQPANLAANQWVIKPLLTVSPQQQTALAQAGMGPPTPVQFVDPKYMMSHPAAAPGKTGMVESARGNDWKSSCPSVSSPPTNTTQDGIQLPYSRTHDGNHESGQKVCTRGNCVARRRRTMCSKALFYKKETHAIAVADMYRQESAICMYMISQERLRILRKYSKSWHRMTRWNNTICEKVNAYGDTKNSCDNTGEILGERCRQKEVLLPDKDILTNASDLAAQIRHKITDEHYCDTAQIQVKQNNWRDTSDTYIKQAHNTDICSDTESFTADVVELSGFDNAEGMPDDTANEVTDLRELNSIEGTLDSNEGTLDSNGGTRDDIERMLDDTADEDTELRGLDEIEGMFNDCFTARCSSEMFRGLPWYTMTEEEMIDNNNFVKDQAEQESLCAESVCVSYCKNMIKSSMNNPHDWSGTIGNSDVSVKQIFPETTSKLKQGVMDDGSKEHCSEMSACCGRDKNSELKLENDKPSTNKNPGFLNFPLETREILSGQGCRADINYFQSLVVFPLTTENRSIMQWPLFSDPATSQTPITFHNTFQMDTDQGDSSKRSQDLCEDSCSEVAGKREYLDNSYLGLHGENDTGPLQKPELKDQDELSTNQVYDQKTDNANEEHSDSEITEETEVSDSSENEEDKTDEQTSKSHKSEHTKEVQRVWYQTLSWNDKFTIAEISTLHGITKLSKLLRIPKTELMTWKRASRMKSNQARDTCDEVKGKCQTKVNDVTDTGQVKLPYHLRASHPELYDLISELIEKTVSDTGHNVADNSVGVSDNEGQTRRQKVSSEIMENKMRGDSRDSCKRESVEILDNLPYSKCSYSQDLAYESSDSDKEQTDDTSCIKSRDKPTDSSGLISSDGVKSVSCETRTSDMEPPTDSRSSYQDKEDQALVGSAQAIKQNANELIEQQHSDYSSDEENNRLVMDLPEPSRVISGSRSDSANERHADDNGKAGDLEVPRRSEQVSNDKTENTNPNDKGENTEPDIDPIQEKREIISIDHPYAHSEGHTDDEDACHGRQEKHDQCPPPVVIETVTGERVKLVQCLSKERMNTFSFKGNRFISLSNIIEMTMGEIASNSNAHHKHHTSLLRPSNEEMTPVDEAEQSGSNKADGWHDGLVDKQKADKTLRGKISKRKRSYPDDVPKLPEQNAEKTVEKSKTVEPSLAFKMSVLAEANKSGLYNAARWYNIAIEEVMKWHESLVTKSIPPKKKVKETKLNLSVNAKIRLVHLMDMHGQKEVSEKFNIPANTLKSWERAHRFKTLNCYTLTEDDIQQIIEYSERRNARKEARSLETSRENDTMVDAETYAERLGLEYNQLIQTREFSCPSEMNEQLEVETDYASSHSHTQIEETASSHSHTQIEETASSHSHTQIEETKTVDGAAGGSTLLLPVSVKEEPVDEEFELLHSHYMGSTQKSGSHDSDNFQRSEGVDTTRSYHDHQPFHVNKTGISDGKTGSQHNNSVGGNIGAEGTERSQSSNNQPLFPLFQSGQSLHNPSRSDSDSSVSHMRFGSHTNEGTGIKAMQSVEKKTREQKNDKKSVTGPTESRNATVGREETNASNVPTLHMYASPTSMTFNISDEDLEQQKALRNTLLALKSRKVTTEKAANSNSLVETSKTQIAQGQTSPGAGRIQSLIKGITNRVGTSNPSKNHENVSLEMKEFLGNSPSKTYSGPDLSDYKYSHAVGTRKVNVSPNKTFNTPLILRRGLRKWSESTSTSSSETLSAESPSKSTDSSFPDLNHLSKDSDSNEGSKDSLNVKNKKSGGVLNLSDKLKSLLQADIFNIVNDDDEDKSADDKEEDLIELLAGSGKKDDKSKNNTTPKKTSPDKNAKQQLSHDTDLTEEEKNLQKRFFYSLGLKQKLGKLALKSSVLSVSQKYLVTPKTISKWKALYQNAEISDLEFTDEEKEELRIVRVMKESHKKLSPGEYQIYIDNPEPDVEEPEITEPLLEDNTEINSEDTVKRKRKPIMVNDDHKLKSVYLPNRPNSPEAQTRPKLKSVYLPSRLNSSEVQSQSPYTPQPEKVSPSLSTKMPMYIAYSDTTSAAEKQTLRKSAMSKDGQDTQTKSGGVFTVSENSEASQRSNISVGNTSALVSSCVQKTTVSSTAQREKVQPVMKAAPSHIPTLPSSERNAASSESSQNTKQNSRITTGTVYLCPLDGVFKYRMPSQDTSVDKTNSRDSHSTAPVVENKSKSSDTAEPSTKFKMAVVEEARKSGFESTAKWYNIPMTDIMKWHDGFVKEKSEKQSRDHIVKHALNHGVIEASEKFTVSRAKVIEWLSMNLEETDQDKAAGPTSPISTPPAEITQPTITQKRGLSFDSFSAKEGKILKPRFGTQIKQPQASTLPAGNVQHKTRMGGKNIQTDIQSNIGIMPRFQKQSGVGLEIASTWKQVQDYLHPTKPPERKYGQDFKTRIIRECELKGQKVVSKEHRIPYNEISRWRLEGKKNTLGKKPEAPLITIQPSTSTISSGTPKAPSQRVMESSPHVAQNKVMEISTPVTQHSTSLIRKDVPLSATVQHLNPPKPKENESLKIKIKLSKNPEIVESNRTGVASSNKKQEVKKKSLLTKSVSDGNKIVKNKNKPKVIADVLVQKEREKVIETTPTIVEDSETDFRMQVVNYCIKNGVLKTQKHFNVTRQSVIDLMNEYDELNRFAVYVYNKNVDLKTKLVSREKTSVEVGISEPVVIVSNLQDYIVTPEYKQSVVDYAVAHGITAATRKYKRKTNTVKSWISQYGKKDTIESLFPEEPKDPTAILYRKKEIVEYARQHGITQAAKTFRKKAAAIKSMMGHMAKIERTNKKLENNTEETGDTSKHNQLKLIIPQPSAQPVSPSPVWDQDFVIKPSSSKSPLKLTLSPRRKSPIIHVATDDVNDIETEDEWEVVDTHEFEEVATWDINIDQDHESKDKNEGEIDNVEKSANKTHQNDESDEQDKTRTVNEEYSEKDGSKSSNVLISPSDVPNILEMGIFKDAFEEDPVSESNSMQQDDIAPENDDDTTAENGESSVETPAKEIVGEKTACVPDVETVATEEDKDQETDDLNEEENAMEEDVIEINESEADMDDDEEDEDIEKIPFEKTIMFQLQTDDIDKFFNSMDTIPTIANKSADNKAEEKETVKKNVCKRPRMYADSQIMANIDETCLFSPIRTARRNTESTNKTKLSPSETTTVQLSQKENKVKGSVEVVEETKLDGSYLEKSDNEPTVDISESKDTADDNSTVALSEGKDTTDDKSSMNISESKDTADDKTETLNEDQLTNTGRERSLFDILGSSNDDTKPDNDESKEKTEDKTDDHKDKDDNEVSGKEKGGVDKNVSGKEEASDLVIDLKAKASPNPSRSLFDSLIKNIRPPTKSDLEKTKSFTQLVLSSSADLVNETSEEKENQDTKPKDRSERNLFDFLTPEPFNSSVKPTEPDSDKSTSVFRQSDKSADSPKQAAEMVKPKPIFKFPKLQLPNFGSIAKLGMAKIKEDDKSKSQKDIVEKKDDMQADKGETKESIGSSNQENQSVSQNVEISNSEGNKTTKGNNSTDNGKTECFKEGVVMETFEELRKRLAQERARKREEIAIQMVDAEVIVNEGKEENERKVEDEAVSNDLSDITDYEMYKDFTPQKIVLILDISKKHGIEFALTSFDLPAAVLANWIIEKDRKQRKIGSAVSLENKLLAVRRLCENEDEIDKIAKEYSVTKSTVLSWKEEVQWLLDSKNVLTVLDKWQRVQSVTSLDESGKSSVKDNLDGTQVLEDLCETSDAKDKDAAKEDITDITDTAIESDPIVDITEKAQDCNKTEESKQGVQTEDSDNGQKKEESESGEKKEIESEHNEKKEEESELSNKKEDESELSNKKEESELSEKNGESEHNEKKGESEHNENKEDEREQVVGTQLPGVLSFVGKTLPRDFTVEQKSMIVLLMDKYGLKDVHRKLGINKGTLWTWKNQNKIVRKFLEEQKEGVRKKTVGKEDNDSKSQGSPQKKQQESLSGLNSSKSVLRSSKPGPMSSKFSSTTVTVVDENLDDIKEDSVDGTLDGTLGRTVGGTVGRKSAFKPTGYRYISPTKLPNSLKGNRKIPTKEYTAEQRVAIVKLVDLYGVRTVHKQFRIPCGSIWNWQHRQDTMSEKRKTNASREEEAAPSKAAKCLSLDGNQSETDPFTIDLITDRVLAAVESTEHVKFKIHQKADVVCMVNHFGMDYVCDKLQSIPRGTVWNWCHNKNILEIVESNMELLKKYRQLIGKKAGFEEEQVDKVMMTQRWLNSCDNSLLRKRKNLDKAGSPASSKKSRSTSDDTGGVTRSEADMETISEADMRLNRRRTRSDLRNSSVGADTKRDSSSDSSVSSISGHSNDFEEIFSDEENNTPSIYSKRSGTSGKISLESKVTSSSTNQIQKTKPKQAKVDKPSSPPKSALFKDIVEYQDQDAPEFDVLRIEPGAHNRLMVLYQVVEKGGKADAPAGSKRQAADYPPGPSSKKKTNSSNKPKDDLGETDAKGNWIPLDEYYYGTMEGEQSYEEEKGEFRFKCWYCSKMLYNNVRAMQHIQGHIDSSKQQNIELSDLTQCKHCYKQFDTPFEMQTHVEKVHLSNKVLMCRICEKDFSASKELIHHMRQNHYASEMPYACQLCNFRSSMYSDVVDHFKKKHDSSNHLLCLYCLRTFDVKFVSQGWGQTQTYYGHLMKHQSKSSAKKCIVCRLTFFNAIDVKTHRKNHHGVNLKGVLGLSGATTTGSPVMIKVPDAGGMPKKKPRGPGLKSLNAPSMSKIQDYGEVQMPEATKKSFCMECKMTMSSLDHYKKHINCSLCRFATSCSVAYANHMMGFHSGQMTSLNLNIPWERAQTEPLYCGCGFSTKYGNKIANHLVFCSKTTCYSQKQDTAAAGTPGTKGEGKQSDGSLLGMLGLVQKKTVSPRVKTAAKAKKEGEEKTQTPSTETKRTRRTKSSDESSEKSAEVSSKKSDDDATTEPKEETESANSNDLSKLSEKSSEKTTEEKFDDVAKAKSKEEKKESVDSDKSGVTDAVTEDKTEPDKTKDLDDDVVQSKLEENKEEPDKSKDLKEEMKSKEGSEEKETELKDEKESEKKTESDNSGESSVAVDVIKSKDDADKEQDADNQELESKDEDETVDEDKEIESESKADMDETDEKHTEEDSESKDTEAQNTGEAETGLDTEVSDKTTENKESMETAAVEDKNDEAEDDNIDDLLDSIQEVGAADIVEKGAENTSEKKDTSEKEDYDDDIIETSDTLKEATDEKDKTVSETVEDTKEEENKVEEEMDTAESKLEKEKQDDSNKDIPEDEEKSTGDNDITEEKESSTNAEIDDLEDDIIETAQDKPDDRKDEAQQKESDAEVAGTSIDSDDISEDITKKDEESSSNKSGDRRDRRDSDHSSQGSHDRSRHDQDRHRHDDRSSQDRDRHRHDDRSRDNRHHEDRSHSSSRSDSHHDNRSHDRGYERDRSHDRSHRDDYRHGGSDNRGHGWGQRGQGHQGNQDRRQDYRDQNYNRNRGNRGGYNQNYRGGYGGGGGGYY